MNELSRRRFLKIAGLSSAGLLLTGTGLGYAATRTPPIQTPHFAFAKENPMSTPTTEPILIAYATRAGSTVEVAAAIGQSLSAAGFSVDVKPVKEVAGVAGYTAVILGSAIRMGRWLPEAVRFVEDNQAALNRLPVALFTVHLLNGGEDAASVAARHAYLDPVRPLLPGAEEVYFTGSMDYSRLSLLDRFIAKMVKAAESDQRDWEQIRGWTPRVLV
jgi:menaquinone-dependent protoporphyrinogen oxidase